MTVSIDINTTFKIEELFSNHRLEFFNREGFRGEELKNQMIKEIKYMLLYGDLIKSIPERDLNISVYD